MDIRITKYCQLTNHRITVNGESVFEGGEAGNYGEFIRSAYKYAGMAYPKFYKMDDLCKLALVAAEILLKDTDVITRYGKDNIGVVFQNGSSTISTDTEFQSTINDRGNYFPSPAVFVYTLPNIMIGEVCIRHKIFGENALFIEDVFNAEALAGHVDIFFEKNAVKCVIAGWVEQNHDHYDAFLYLAEGEARQTSADSMMHEAGQLRSFYKTP
jgi:hypothetical protein